MSSDDTNRGASRLERVGQALGDRSRVVMLEALMDGRAWTAGELADRAGITRPTASHHLEVLENGGLVSLTPSGRHRYVRLASADVARWLEASACLLAPPRRPEPPPGTFEHARLCYDHLAGRVAVVLAERLLASGWLADEGDTFAIPEARRDVWRSLGVGEGPRTASRRCLDCTERRFHLGGAAGAALVRRMFDDRHLVRVKDTRILNVTATGRRFLETWPG